MPFDSFSGNAHCVDVLRTALRRGRLPHALLFAGPDAVGKKCLAQQLAMALNCQESLDADWCGACRSCHLIQLGNHPDVSILEPEGPGEVIRIDRVRQLIREAVRNPFQGKYRVFILDEAHRLNPASANSLLKILEEPPLSSVLVLVTSQPHALLTTVRSRCQLVQFAALAEPEIAAILQSRFKFQREEATQRARLAGGSLGKAVALDLKRHVMLAEAARAFLQTISGTAGVREIADTLIRIGKERQDTEDWIGILLQELRTLACAGTRHGKGGEEAAPFTLGQIETMTHALERLRRNLNHNINRSLALETLYLQFCRMLAQRG